MDRQADHDPVIQAFITWIRKVSQPGLRGPGPDPNCTFVPLSQIETYFQDVSRVTRLLRSVLGPDELLLSLPAIAKKYPRVFSILLLIGKGRFIQYFARYETLCDQRLPFEVKPQCFPTSTETSDDSFFATFRDCQWQFCAHTFQPSDIDLHLGKETILPIVKREKLGSGASAVVFKINIHEAYNQLEWEMAGKQASQMIFHNHRIRRTGAHTCQRTNDSSKDVFVLKSYCTRDAEKYYGSEVAAFRRLNLGAKNDSSLIGFYGSFVQNDTYSILLQYADVGTLERYFQTFPEPIKGKDIIKFWRNLFAIITALVAIHQVEPSDMNGPAVLQGFVSPCADVKSNSIF